MTDPLKAKIEKIKLSKADADLRSQLCRADQEARASDLANELMQAFGPTEGVTQARLLEIIRLQVAKVHFVSAEDVGDDEMIGAAAVPSDPVDLTDGYAQ